MGSGISGLYNGPNGSKTKYLNPSFKTNLAKTSKKYKMTKGGYFGKKSSNAKHNSTRTIKCKNSPYAEAKKFFKKLTQGYKAKDLNTKYGKGKIVKFDDGTVVTFRPVTSSPKSPAVDIQITLATSKFQKQKIHFSKKV